MNKIVIIGNLTANPEIRQTQNGTAVCSFNVAVNRRFAGTDGARATDFFRINAWRGTAESCAKYLAKGRKVAVVGELQARLYDAKDGTTRLSLDVQAEEIEFLTPKQTAENATVADGKITPDSTDGFTDINPDELPF